MNDERLLASWGRGEDAALWEIDETRLGVLTVDFITPVVDEPFRYGEIAAANSLSDVFAMGGRPIVALNVVCFPTSCEPIETLRDILQGGASKVAECGAVLAGGHSVQDDEPKYGLVVYGEVERGREWRIDGARPGDLLILTKPLGTGVAVTAIKAGLASPADADAAYRSMSSLNDPRRAKADRALWDAVHACTDVTGFGLAGHARDMTGPDQELRIRFDALPILPGVRDAAAMGLIPAGTYANREHLEPHVRIEVPDDARAFAQDIVFDPQTSGGLLLAVEPGAASALSEALKDVFPHTAIVGAFANGDGMLRIV